VRKKGMFLAILLILLLLVLSGCIGNLFNQPLYDIKSSISNGETLPPKSVITVGLEKNGALIDSLVKVYNKDGVVYYEATTTKLEHVIVANDEGEYEVEISDPEVDVKKTLKFNVTALEREVYLDGGTIYYDYLSEDVLAPATDLWVRFYKYSEKTLDNGEKVSERLRLNLIDVDEDGIYDKWEELPNASSNEQGWYYIPNHFSLYNTVWDFYYFEYRENLINLVYKGVEGYYAGYILTFYFANVGFELNTMYARYVDTNDSSAYTYGQFMLHERYDSDSKPLFELSSDKINVAPGDTLKVYVKAENVADFAKLYDVRYMQFALNHSTMLLLDSVEFPEFMDGLSEVSAYNNNDTSVVLYKGFFDEEDETESATDTIAVLNFTLSDDATGDLSIALAYEGWWNTYEDYPDLPNPIIKDKNNSNVDGFVFDHGPLVVTVGGEE